MFTLNILAITLAITTPTMGRPTYEPLSRRQDSNIVTSGATTGGVQSRLEIHDLQANDDQWNIYLLALQSFKAMDPSDPMSWYQIAGIHGQPYVAWDGVEMCSNCSATGYCTHSSTLFPTWHRAYLLLFEQSLLANALAVANQFSGDNQTKYVQAADNLRMPYWDWALIPPEGEDPFPQVFTDEAVTVITPSGEQTITNPLLYYSFGDSDHSWTVDPSSEITTRAPTFTADNRQQLRTSLWTILTSQQDFNAFSTESLQPNGDNYNPASLEAVHDQVHVLVGGDMGNIPTAAFDPVFWLHHSAIDRAFAIWQAANTEAWLEPWAEVGSSMAYASGTVEDSSSLLEPFRASDSSGDFWDSDDMRKTSSWGYQYADLVSGQSVANLINSLYGDFDTSNLKRSDTSVTASHSSPHYIANIRANSMAHKGSFTVFLFDGAVNSDDSSTWHTASNLLGSHGFFTGPNSHGDGTALVNAGVPLTDKLLRSVATRALSNMSNSAVANYLKEKMQLAVVALDRRVIDVGNVLGLEVEAVTADVVLPGSGSEMALWGPFKPLTEVTVGSVAGYVMRGLGA